MNHSAMKPAKRGLLSTLGAICLILALSACKEEPLRVDPGKNDLYASLSTDPGGSFENPDPEAVDLARKNMARALAKALVRPGVRSFLYDQFLDSTVVRESEILYALVAQETIGGETFAEILYNESDEAVSDTFFSQEIFLIDPLITFALHTPNYEVSGWNFPSEVPNAAYVPYSFDEESHSTVSGFDASGDSLSYDSDGEPEETVIIVTENEFAVVSVAGEEIYWDGRTAEEITGTEHPAHDSCLYVAGVRLPKTFGDWRTLDFIYIDLAAYIQCINSYNATHGDGPGGGSNPCTNCDNAQRDARNKWDRFLSAKFNSYQDTRDVEQWYDGPRLEIWGYCIYTDAQGNTGYSQIFFEAYRNQLTNWHAIHPARFVINWDQSKYGDQMRYVLYERDKSANNTDSRQLATCINNTEYVVTESFPVRTGSNFNRTWQLVADVTVNYCDDVNWPNQKIQNGSRMKFTINEPW